MQRCEWRTGGDGIRGVGEMVFLARSLICLLKK